MFSLHFVHSRTQWLCLAAGLLIGILLLTGCRTNGATHEVALETPFYLDGPQQARPADGTLAAGTRVTLAREAGSYAEVTLPDGRRAYVAADSLGPLR